MAPYSNTVTSGQTGLPNWAATGGTLSSVYTQTNGTHTVFQLQPYGLTAGTTTTLTNNVAAVGSGGSLTMPLKTPAPFNALQLLYSGQSEGNYNLTLNFADGTTYSYNSNYYSYWVDGASDEAAQNIGLVSQGATAWSSGANSIAISRGRRTSSKTISRSPRPTSRRRSTRSRSRLPAVAA